MIQTTLKLAFRNLAKNKVHSMISIIALAIGFTVFILIGLYLRYEYSWDKKNINYDRIYRVQQKVDLSTGTEFWTQSQAALARHIRENYPEAENAVLLREAWGEFLSSSEVQTFFEEDGYYADQNVFDIFSYEFVKGDPGTSLSDPYSIVLSDRLAEKLFPGEDAMEKYVLLEKKYNLKVTGVYKEPDYNSSVRPSYLIPFQLFEKTNNWQNVQNNWTATSFQTYVLLKHGVKKEMLESKIARLLDDYEVLKKQHELYLVPLKDVYLHPTDRNDYLVAVFLYGLIAVFILLLASVNFINLTTANASVRAREIGVKKANGSSRIALVFQFLGESVMIALLAVNVAFVIAKLFLPVFSRIINRELAFSYQEHSGFILMLLGIGVVVGLLSGLYPSMFLSSFKTVNILKSGTFKTQKGKTGLKKILVTFQLHISAYLLISTIIVTKQIHFMMTKDRGFNIYNILYAQFRSTREDGNVKNLRNLLLSNPEVENVTISRNVPFHGSEGRSINWEGSGEDQINSRYNRVDDKFLETYRIELIQGRNFQADYSGEIKECIINETALKTFGWEDPIGKKLYDNQYQVIGVVKDFCHNNLHDRIEPYVFVLHSGNVYGENIFSVRVKPDNILQTRRMITEIFENYFPDDAFEFWFLEEKLHRGNAYRIWDGVKKTFKFFSVLAIIISIMGLLGLISFTAKRRTKEMGIRKVLGSKPLQIYLLFIKEYVPLLIISIILSTVTAIIFYDYIPGAYKYRMQLVDFVYAWFLTIMFTLLTITYQAIKVATSNPVKSLRYE